VRGDGEESDNAKGGNYRKMKEDNRYAIEVARPPFECSHYDGGLVGAISIEKAQPSQSPLRLDKEQDTEVRVYG
jgi:hypothetical protein